MDCPAETLESWTKLWKRISSKRAWKLDPGGAAAAIAELLPGYIGVANKPEPKTVFLNFPYDHQFEPLFLAYVSGICSYGLTPRVALEIPGGERRLDRIIELIESCRYSFHDLSRVELDLRRPRTPRMNMPFELGLTVMVSYYNPKHHTWCVFEKNYRRPQKSVSDLAGTDVYSHNGRPKGVLRQIGNALVRENGMDPAINELLAVHADVQRTVPTILRRAGTKSCYEARVFKELVYVTQRSVTRRIGAMR